MLKAMMSNAVGNGPPNGGSVNDADRQRRLDLFKTLGDNTRYAIYLELARSPRPLTTAEIADTLDLHTNTVRPHLERMRELLLVEMHTDSRGEVGRPQHRYMLAPHAPSLGLAPPSMPMLARLLVDLTARLGCTGTQAHEVGFGEGERRGRGYTNASSALEALVADLDMLGFDPIVSDYESDAAIGDSVADVEAPSNVDDAASPSGHAVLVFGNCPFGDLARDYPGIVCRLHHGIVDGTAASLGGMDVVRFGTVSDELPCHAVVSVA